MSLKKLFLLSTDFSTSPYESTLAKNILSTPFKFRLTSSNEVCGEIVNVGTGTNHSVLDIVDLLKPGYFEYIPARSGEARDTLADISKAKKLLNYEPKIKLEDWIANHKKEINLWKE